MSDNRIIKEEKNEGELLLPQEKRDYPRIAVNIKVLYRVLENDEADIALVKHFDPEKVFKSCSTSEVVNLSTSGLLMYTAENIATKSFVAVNMYIPLPGLSCACRAIAEVIRCSAENGKFLIALKFLKVIHHDLNKFKYCTLNDLLEIKGGEDIKLG
jgi:hypothetical protein